jgi:hypothetical protein
MHQRDHDDPRLHDVDGRVRERADEHTTHAFWESTVPPGRAGQRLLIDSRESGLGLEQEALAEPSHTIVVLRRCLGHFSRCGYEDFSHVAPIGERELELAHPPSWSSGPCQSGCSRSEPLLLPPMRPPRWHRAARRGSRRGEGRALPSHRRGEREHRLRWLRRSACPQLSVPVDPRPGWGQDPVRRLRFPGKTAPNSGTSLTRHMHKGRKPQRWLGFSVEAPGIEPGSARRPISFRSRA